VARFNVDELLAKHIRVLASAIAARTAELTCVGSQSCDFAHAASPDNGNSTS